MEIKSKLTFKTYVAMPVILLALFFIGGCNNNGERGQFTLSEVEARYTPDPNIPAWQLDNREETVFLTWFVQADWWNTDFGDDFVTSRIKEDLKIEIEFITGDEMVLNTIFASGELPDLVTLFGADSQAAQSANTWAFSLNELAEKYDPHFFEVASSDTLNWFQLEEGSTYGYANYSNTFYDYENDTIPSSTAFLIRTDAYETIGRLPMGTPEEFEKAMEKIAQMFPELTPFGFNAMGEETGSLGHVFQNFIGVPIETGAGEFYNRNLDEDYLTWIKVLNKLHKKGHISDDSFADDYTIFEEKVEMGTYATLLVDGLSGLGGRLQSFMSSNPESEYIAIDGPQSTVGNEPALAQAGISGWMINYINQNAIDPAVAMQLFTYLLSDKGQMLVFFGEEGETFTFLDNGRVSLLPEIEEMRLNENDQFKREYRLAEFVPFGHDRYNALNDTAFVEAIRQPQQWGIGKLSP